MTLDWLTYFSSPARGVWHLGPVPIRAYALCIIVGIVAALLIGDRRWRARGGEPGVIYDIALWAVPFGLIGGRLYHLMTDWRTYFGPGGIGWEATPRIWDGGLGIWGAVALGGVGAWIGCRRRGIPLPAFGDAVAPGIVLAQAIGRIGNYFNQELYGRETTLPWGLEIFWREDAAGIRDPHLLDGVSTGELYKIVQPTFLYELLWNLAVFAVLIYADRRFRMGHGRLFALYIAGYCIGRFGIELLRDDAATHIAGIRVNSFTSTFVFIGAVVYILLATKGREDPEVLRRAWQPDESEQPPAEVETDSELEGEQEVVAVAAANGVGSVVQLPEWVSGQAESVDADVADAEVADAADVDDQEDKSDDEDKDDDEDEDIEAEDIEAEDIVEDIEADADEHLESAVADAEPDQDSVTEETDDQQADDIVGASDADIDELVETAEAAADPEAVDEVAPVEETEPDAEEGPEPDPEPNPEPAPEPDSPDPQPDSDAGEDDDAEPEVDEGGEGDEDSEAEPDATDDAELR